MTTNLNRLTLHGRDVHNLWWFCRRGEPLGPYHCIGRGLRELRTRFESRALDVGQRVTTPQGEGQVKAIATYDPAYFRNDLETTHSISKMASDTTHFQRHFFQHDDGEIVTEPVYYVRLTASSWAWFAESEVAR